MPARDDWYVHVSLQGRVTAITDDIDLRDIDRLSRHYIGEAYPNRKSPRVSAQVEIERWHAWGVQGEGVQSEGVQGEH